VRVLIAVKGSEEARFFVEIATLTPLQAASNILLAHVVDMGPRADVERGRDRFLVRRPLAPERLMELTRVEEEGAQAVLQFARQTLVAVGVPDAHIHEMILRGKPNEELQRLTEAERTDLVVVGGRPGKPGPHSLGKTARFLIDHAPRAALLVR
jgi:nucleotide-binding universal stress UspA family protein